MSRMQIGIGGPIPGKIFLGQVNKGMSYIGVVWNEPSVEVGKAKEGSDILHLGGYRCIAFGVSVFEGFLKLCYKILKGSEGKGGGGGGKGELLEGECPCGCRSFVHI